MHPKMFSARLAFNHISLSVSFISLKSLASLYHHTFLPLFFRLTPQVMMWTRIMAMMRDGGNGDAADDDYALSMTGCNCIKLSHSSQARLTAFSSLPPAT